MAIAASVPAWANSMRSFASKVSKSMTSRRAAFWFTASVSTAMVFPHTYAAMGSATISSTSRSRITAPATRMAPTS